MLICLKSAEELTVGEKLNPRRIQSSGGKVQHPLLPFPSLPSQKNSRAIGSVVPGTFDRQNFANFAKRLPTDVCLSHARLHQDGVFSRILLPNKCMPVVSTHEHES